MVDNSSACMRYASERRIKNDLTYDVQFYGAPIKGVKCDHIKSNVGHRKLD